MPMHPPDPFFEFAQGPIELDRGALIIAQERRPDLDITHYLRLLDGLANNFSLPNQPSDLRNRIDCFNTYLFEELGFRGNREAYEDPQNSYLDAVLERRLGIPITLSVVYIEIGRRVGLPIFGVNFPYHFLVGCDAPEEPVFIDPFECGTCLSKTQLTKRLPVVEGNPLRFSEHFIAPAAPRDILARMLRNLKRVHVNERRLSEAIHCGQRIAWLVSDEAENYRDLGFLYYRAHQYKQSIKAFEQYLRCANDPSDRDEIEQNIRVISGRLAMLN